jgi:hypothetical protein
VPAGLGPGKGTRSISPASTSLLSRVVSKLDAIGKATRNSLKRVAPISASRSNSSVHRSPTMSRVPDREHRPATTGVGGAWVCLMVTTEDGEPAWWREAVVARTFDLKFSAADVHEGLCLRDPFGGDLMSLIFTHQPTGSSRGWTGASAEKLTPPERPICASPPGHGHGRRPRPNDGSVSVLPTPSPSLSVMSLPT